MINICIVVTDAISFNVLMKGQLEYLKSTGKYNVTLISGGSKLEIDRLMSRNVGTVLEFPFVREPSLLKDLCSLIKLTFHFFKNRYDLVVYSTPKAFLISSIASFLSCHKNRVAIIRGRVYENFYGIKRNVFKTFDYISLKLSSHVCFISPSIQNAYLSEGLIKNGCSIVLGSGSSNGVDISRFSTVNLSKADVLKEFGFQYDDFIVVNVGRQCLDKGILELEAIVEANKNPHIKFIVVGRIEDQVAEKVISRLSGRDDFQYIPHLNDVTDIFKIAVLHLFLSHREGFGNVAVEAAASNTPTFAFDVVGVRDSVKDGVSGKLFSFKDTCSISHDLQLAASNRSAFLAQYPTMESWVSSEFSQEFVWQNYSRYFIDIYEKNI